MGYFSKTWTFPDSIEHEICFAGKYGKKGEKRLPRKKRTSEQMQWQNALNKKNKIRRLIKANFTENDLWVTLTVQKEKRCPMKGIKKELKKFFDNMRRQYRKEGQAFKFIYLIEIGKKGGIHVHLIINRCMERPPDVLICKYWKLGHPDIKLLYREGGFADLANYLSNMPDKDGKQKRRENAEECFNTSRNLIRPEPERKRYFRRTAEKMIREGPKPRKGYYIDKSSVKTGINRVTGYSYLYYTEVRETNGRKNE